TWRSSMRGSCGMRAWIRGSSSRFGKSLTPITRLNRSFPWERRTHKSFLPVFRNRFSFGDQTEERHRGTYTTSRRHDGPRQDDAQKANCMLGAIAGDIIGSFYEHHPTKSVTDSES